MKDCGQAITTAAAAQYDSQPLVLYNLRDPYRGL